MEIILSKACESFTGSLGRGFGYYIRRHGERFFSQRSKYGAPPSGHWRFIRACAELAQTKLHITDIQVKPEEADAARKEAGLKPIAYSLPSEVLDAGDVMYIVKHYDI